ncbi:Salutaridine reductase, partial [Nymphaea thermarum]
AHLAWANGGSDSYESARGCLETNFYGTKRLTKALVPLLRPSSHKPRIVNVSSRYGLLCLLRDDEFRKELCDMVALTEEKIDQVLDMFLEDVKSDKGMDRATNSEASYCVLCFDEITDIWCLSSWLQAADGAEWWSEATVAVVTGASRGIGLEVCRQLADKGLTVIMTARQPQEQLPVPAQQFLQEAAEAERKKKIIFHSLDITQQQSVMDFVVWLKQHVGFVDILVNNAGVNNSAIDWGVVERDDDDKRAVMGHLVWANGTSDRFKSARGCLETNFYGTKRLTKALLPLLRPSSHKPRIVNVSSRYGLLCRRGQGKTPVSPPGSTTAVHPRVELYVHSLLYVWRPLAHMAYSFTPKVLDMFLEDVKSEKRMDRWPIKLPTYSISKISLNAYTRLLALQLHDKACVNSVHPGYVMTDMNFGIGDLSPAEDAANLVRIALLPPGGPSGHNFLESKDVSF